MTSPWDDTCHAQCVDPPNWSKSGRRELTLLEPLSDLHTRTMPQPSPLNTHNILTNTIANNSSNDCNMFTLNVGRGLAGWSMIFIHLANGQETIE